MITFVLVILISLGGGTIMKTDGGTGGVEFKTIDECMEFAGKLHEADASGIKYGCQMEINI